MDKIRCPYCGSERIEFGVAWGKSAETGNVGLKYSNGTGFFSPVGVAQVYSDLCLDCSTLLRTYIKEDPNGKYWSHSPGSLGSK